MAIFLGENGVLSMGNKTPVTILQETLQKRGITPQYELLYDGTGTLDPVFKYQVSSGNLSAIGDGKTKKAAKHDAAAAMLKRMQVNKALTESADIIGTEEVDIASPYTGAIKENFVGLLDEVCYNNRIPNPAYFPVREEGPPHARVFTIQCKVSSISETAIARTKKQAKHLAAQQMINRIVDILGDSYIPLSDKTSVLDDGEDFFKETSNLKAIECGTSKIDYSMPVSNMQNAFFYKTEEYIMPKKFLDLNTEPEEFYDSLENPKVFLDNLVEELGGICKTESFTKDSLTETLEVVEKHLERFYWDEDDSSSKEETDGEDEEASDLGKYTLEEFPLDDDEESPTPLILEDSSKPEKYEEAVSNEEGSAKISETHKQFGVFLDVQCLQGCWSFPGCGKSSDEAANVAAIGAIKFFRVLSIPRLSKATSEESS